MPPLKNSKNSILAMILKQKPAKQTFLKTIQNFQVSAFMLFINSSGEEKFSKSTATEF